MSGLTALVVLGALLWLTRFVINGGRRPLGAVRRRTGVPRLSVSGNRADDSLLMRAVSLVVVAQFVYSPTFAGSIAPSIGAGGAAALLLGLGLLTTLAPSLGSAVLALAALVIATEDLARADGLQAVVVTGVIVLLMAWLAGLRRVL